MNEVSREILEIFESDYDYSRALKKIEDVTGYKLHPIDAVCGEGNAWWFVGDYIMAMERSKTDDGYDITSLELYSAIDERFGEDDVEVSFGEYEVDTKSIDIILDLIKNDTELGLSDILGKILDTFKECGYDNIDFDRDMEEFLGASHLLIGGSQYIHVYYDIDNSIFIEKLYTDGYDFDRSVSVPLNYFDNDNYKDMIKNYIRYQLETPEALLEEFEYGGEDISYALGFMTYLLKRKMFSIDMIENESYCIIRSLCADYMIYMKVVEPDCHCTNREIYYRMRRGLEDSSATLLKLDLTALKTMMKKLRESKLDANNIIQSLAEKNIDIRMENDKVKVEWHGKVLDVDLIRHSVLRFSDGHNGVEVSLGDIKTSKDVEENVERVITFIKSL